MKTLLILVALFIAFGIAGAMDYQAEAGMAAERFSVIAGAADGGRR